MRGPAPRRLDPHDRVDQPGRPDHLLDDLAAGHRDLVVAGRGRDEQPPVELLLPLVKPQRPVVERAGKPEPVLDQRALAAEVAGEHAPDLGHRHVRLVDDQQAVRRKEVEQRGRRLARLAAGEVARVILDPRAIADLHEHLHVVPRPRRQPLRLQELALFLQLLEPLLQLLADALDGPLDPFLGQDEVLGRVDIHLLVRLEHAAGQRVDRRQPLDLIAEELDPVAELFIGRPELDHVAAHPELAPLERHVVAFVLDVDELQEHLVAVDRCLPSWSRTIILR